MNSNPIPSVNPGASPIDFARVSLADRATIIAIAERAVALGKLMHGLTHSALRAGSPMLNQIFRDRTIELNPTVVGMDIAVCHLWRNLDLRGFLAADDLVFQAEFARIQVHVNRRLCSFPESVRLRFARIGERGE